MTATAQPDMIRARLNLETSKIAWKDLQRFFAAGMALAVAEDLDLVEAAFQMSKDNATQIRQWMEAGKFDRVSDEQAAAWFERDARLWAVVVSPWVLVQQIRK